MGRYIVVGLFLVMFTSALLLYFTREVVSLRENLDSRVSDEPRLKMGDFTLFRFEKDVLKSVLKAHYGDFRAPNTVELHGDVAGSRYTEKGREDFSTQLVKVKLRVESVDDLFKESEIDSAYLPIGVLFNFRDYKLTSEKAKVFGKEKVIVGENNVFVEGNSRWFKGKEGFHWDMEKESLNIFGLVEGEILPNEKTKK